MSKGPGRWQRVILERLATEEGCLLVECLFDHLGCPPTHTEYSAMYRAAVLLAKQGGCTLDRVWRTNFDGRRTAFVWVCRPGVPIQRNAVTKFEERLGVPNPFTHPDTFRVL